MSTAAAAGVEEEYDPISLVELNSESNCHEMHSLCGGGQLVSYLSSFLFILHPLLLVRVVQPFGLADEVRVPVIYCPVRIPEPSSSLSLSLVR